MNWFFKFSVPLLILTIILGSCKTSSDVTSQRLIQKRKYQKGFHINGLGKYKSSNYNHNSIAESNIEKQESSTQQKINKVKDSEFERIPKDETDGEINKPIYKKQLKATKEYKVSPPNLVQEGDTIKVKVGKAEKKEKDNIGLAGVIIGGVSLLLGLAPIGILSIFFGIASLKRHKNNPETYGNDTTMSWISIGLGLLNLLITLVVIVIVILFFAIILGSV